MKTKILAFILTVSVLLVPLSGCSDSGAGSSKQRMESIYGENREINGDYDKSASAVCSNGIFVGKDKNGVRAFKGIPFAQPPTGSLRWKPPVPADDGRGVYEAYYFGRSPLQTEWPSEVSSYYPKSEDCLYLNVWTARTDTPAKAVMVFFYGGSYGWGGTSDPLYDGENFVRAHPETVLVTAGYRTGIMGFIDFSSLEDGEDYKESGNLGLLDMVCALEWVQKNISAFGGDNSNVTIFGESAGGGAVSLLPLIDGTRGLFNRVIAESGSIALTYGRDECARLTGMLTESAGVSTVRELKELTEDELIKINEGLNDFNNFPERDGVVLPEDLYGAYSQGKAAHVDMLIGTNADEVRYWINEMGYYVPFPSGEFIYRLAIPVMYESDTKRFSPEDKKLLKSFMNLQSDSRIWNITEFYNEILFRVPALFQAQANSENGGRAFVYYWKYPSALKNSGACHAVELAYLFNNTDETIYTGDNINMELAARVQEMWVNFALTGNPGTADTQWREYNSKTRESMVIDTVCGMEKDILGSQRELIEPLLGYGLNGCYTALDFNVPSVYSYAVAVIFALGLITAVIIICAKKRKRKKHE